MTLRGVILAGGKGTRLGELTKVTNKHLLPVGPYPMVYHPLKKLVDAGIRDVLLVSGTEHMGDFVELLGSGKAHKCALTYRVQDEAGGIAQALGLAELRGDRILSIEEKPERPKSDFAVAGIYLYPPDVFDIVKTLRPSRRGELEITDVNRHYLEQGRLGYSVIQGYWTDAGTLESLALANQLVREAPPVF